jgi:hypothetical protein
MQNRAKSESSAQNSIHSRFSCFISNAVLLCFFRPIVLILLESFRTNITTRSVARPRPVLKHRTRNLARRSRYCNTMISASIDQSCHPKGAHHGNIFCFVPSELYEIFGVFFAPAMPCLNTFLLFYAYGLFPMALYPLRWRVPLHRSKRAYARSRFPHTSLICTRHRCLQARWSDARAITRAANRQIYSTIHYAFHRGKPRKLWVEYQ